ncbi:MAG: ribonuclease Z [Nitrospirae bacterium]|nr:ribonuclease Z [Nitrospirota bacterium]
MKPTFHAETVNDPLGDPALFLRLLRERRALLFDLGDISRLSAADMMKVSDVFITHMHIDHFIGFDMLLRVLLRRESPLRVFGPLGVTDAVEGKLKGYTWNLIHGYPTKIDVYEVSGSQIKHTGFYAENEFMRLKIGTDSFKSIILQEEGFAVRALELWHGMPVLAYSINEGVHININKEALASMNLSVGRWITEFKHALRTEASDDKIFNIDGKQIALADLRPAAIFTKGQKITYATDISPADENIEKISEFAKDADVLFCEAFFLHAEIDRARERNHLTAAIAGKIAKDAGVKRLQTMHFSPKYTGRENEIIDEAEAAFRGDI